MNTYQLTPAVRWLEWHLAFGLRTDKYVVERLQALISTAQHAIKDIEAGETAWMEDFAFPSMESSLADAFKAFVKHTSIKTAIEQVKQYQEECTAPVEIIQSA
jgi:ATP-dependent RNA circularization protein (DNA/RNA ligase family)